MREAVRGSGVSCHQSANVVLAVPVIPLQTFMCRLAIHGCTCVYRPRLRTGFAAPMAHGALGGELWVDRAVANRHVSLFFESTEHRVALRVPSRAWLIVTVAARSVA